MASDAPTRGGGSLARVLGLLAVLLVLGVLAWAIVRQYGGAEPGGSEQPAAASVGCARELTVRVSTTEDFAPVVVAAADRLEDDDACTVYAVSTAPSAVTAGQIRGDATLAHVWIPDSSVWVDRVNQDPAAPSLTPGPTLATTPVVLALPATLAESTGMSGSVPWQELLGPPLLPRIGEPTEATASLLLVHAAEQALGGTPHGEQLLGGELIRMSRQTAAEADLLTSAGRDGEEATAVVATEQQVARQHADNPAAPLTPVAPAEGAPALDFPWVPLPGPDQGVGVREALAALEESLTGPDGVADLRAAGFRTGDGDGAPDVPGMPADLARVPAPTAAAADAAVTTWNTVQVDMRMLAVIDVSGSMLEPVEGQTRVQLAAASAATALEVFPPTSQVGLWMFSTDHPGGTDWTELAPIAPLHATGGAGTHRDALLAAASSLPARTVEGGDTGLYDTVLAAYREVQANYEPGYVNSVVLLTDGINEDEQSITLGELLAELQAGLDPSRPIPVITVGMGPDADAEVLNVISAQTGGRSYLARDPADIRTVFVDALTHRLRVG